MPCFAPECKLTDWLGGGARGDTNVFVLVFKSCREFHLSMAILPIGLLMPHVDCLRTKVFCLKGSVEHPWEPLPSGFLALSRAWLCGVVKTCIACPGLARDHSLDQSRAESTAPSRA